MELYNALDIPFSSEQTLRNVQEKILNGDELTLGEKLIVGRDYPVKVISGQTLKPDHVYRAVKEHIFNIYIDKGIIFSNRQNDEYEEFTQGDKVYNNNMGIDWYLGGASLKYGGGDFIIECPASKEYFFPAYDNGNHLSFDPTIKHFKSSGNINPVPMDLVTRVFDLREYKNHLNEENAEDFIKIIEYKNYDSTLELDEKKLR